MRLRDQVAVVTGGGSGIGRAIAHRFAAEGCLAVVADVRSVSADRVRDEIRDEGGRAVSAVVDVTDPDGVDRMAKETLATHGRIDILVNNAVVPPADGLRAMTLSAWRRDMAISVDGPFLCTKAVLPGMIEQGRGAVVNVTSVNAFEFYGREAYSAAKAALVNLTKSTAVRYGRHGVRANALAAGTVRTPGWQQRTADDPNLLDRAAKWYPLGRVGDPEDVASAALFLASPAAAWVTGVVLPVDGGLSAGNYLMAVDLGMDPNG